MSHPPPHTTISKCSPGDNSHSPAHTCCQPQPPPRSSVDTGRAQAVPVPRSMLLLCPARPTPPCDNDGHNDACRWLLPLPACLTQVSPSLTLPTPAPSARRTQGLLSHPPPATCHAALCTIGTWFCDARDPGLCPLLATVSGCNKHQADTHIPRLCCTSDETPAHREVSDTPHPGHTVKL